MRTTLLTLALLLVPMAAHAGGTVGQSVIYRYNSTHSYLAVITSVNGDGSYGLVMFDPDDYTINWIFGPNSQGAYATIALSGVFEDESLSSDNRWHINAAVPRALVTATGTPTLTIGGSAVQLDATHDVEYTAVLKIANTLTISGGSAGHVDLVCDGSATPTTVVETVSAENTGTLTAGITLTQSVTSSLRWRVPAAHYCKLSSTNDTGTPTYTLVRQVAQILGD